MRPSDDLPALHPAAQVGGLRGASGDHETVLLLTDGEDLGGRGLEVARRCRERGITVHAVGFGSALGAKIPIDRGGREGYLRDRLGKEVISALDPTSLRLIAETTGGAYVSGSRVDPLVELYERRILPMARKAFETSAEDQRAQRFQWPLLLAFLLCVVELALPEGRKR